jgi:hypothetical protein
LLVLVMSLVAPHFLKAQLFGNPFILLLTFLAIGFLFVAPCEWFLHRFAMHQVLAFRLLPWLKIKPEDDVTGIRRRLRRARNSMSIAMVYYLAKMAFGHGAHHKLTDVTPVNAGGMAELFNAVSRYEILDNDRTEHAAFPHGAIVLFWLVFAPLMAVLQLAADALSRSALHLPHLPIVLAFTLALTWQVWVYENSHAIMHKRFDEWWQPRMKRPLVGRWYSMVYRFHFFHHMNESCSLGVVGAVWFCYFWDWVFGTYKLARLELIQSASRVNRDVLEMRKEEIMILPNATAEDFAPPPRRRRWVEHLERQSEEAHKIWNGLFVQALSEVRRRKAALDAAS